MIQGQAAKGSGFSAEFMRPRLDPGNVVRRLAWRNRSRHTRNRPASPARLPHGQPRPPVRQRSVAGTCGMSHRTTSGNMRTASAWKRGGFGQTQPGSYAPPYSAEARRSGVTFPPAFNASQKSAHRCIMRRRSGRYSARQYAALTAFRSAWASCASMIWLGNPIS